MRFFDTLEGQLGAFFAIPVILMLLTVAVWGTNVYKLTQCDFQAPYKCEAIHGVGLVPPLAFVTVWFDHDTTAKKGE